MRQLRLDVTQNDIDTGHACSGGECPLAMVIDRAIRGEFQRDINVDSDVIYLRIRENPDDEWQSLVLVLPADAVDFIFYFDCAFDEDEKPDSDVFLIEIDDDLTRFFYPNCIQGVGNIDDELRGMR